MIEKFIKLKIKKLSKSRNLKGEKLFKSQNLAKLRKKLSNNGNLPNFNIIKIELNFLIFDTRIAFNYLWLAFIKIPIFWYFDLEYYI